MQQLKPRPFEKYLVFESALIWHLRVTTIESRYGFTKKRIVEGYPEGFVSPSMVASKQSSADGNILRTGI